MIRISQIRIPVMETGQDKTKEAELVRRRAASVLKVRPDDLRKCMILRRSEDLRDKSRLLFVYTVLVRLKDSVAGPGAENELLFIKRLRDRNVTQDALIPVTIPKVPMTSPALTCSSSRA